MTKVFCGSPAEKAARTIGDPVLGSPAIGISGDYPVTFTGKPPDPATDEVATKTWGVQAADGSRPGVRRDKWPAGV